MGIIEKTSEVKELNVDCTGLFHARSMARHNTTFEFLGSEAFLNENHEFDLPHSNL